ncbi:MAG: heme lyase CcmF/NrfE family subunit [Rhodobacterales bacterium]|nr:heme lyase CcmF/NrfE family subunit [Rhodobacterales bacterium]
MIVEAGHFALILSLFVALVQAALPLAGAQRNDPAWMGVAAPAAFAQALLIAFSFGCLTYAFVTSDFSVAAVVANSHSTKPMLYKVSGVWGNHEGSMLLWVLILAVFGWAVALFGRNLPPSLKARTLGIQALISVGFLAFILFTSNPFDRAIPAPFDGRGMNPLLQDPGLAFHPPFLYLGYVGFSIAFSFAIAALIEGRVDAAWARWVRPWTLAAWSFLTIGIALGSWWAYYELGWGGWWFWDPVENASFMPWLAGTALLHSAVVVEKRDTMKAWTVFLAIVAFSFSLLGTFLVRSGVLTSVHAFATDPERGVFILVLLLIVVGGSFALFAWRGPQLTGGGLFRPISREGSLLLNNLLMSIGAVVVLFGTLFPLFAQVVDYKMSVGAPFFNRVFVPLMVPMIATMAVAPLLSWKRGDLPGAMGRLWAAGAAAAAAVAVAIAVATKTSVWGPIGLALAAWLAMGTVVELAERIRLFRTSPAESLRRLGRMPRAAWGMTLAHFGMAVAIAGMTGAGVWKVESIQTMKPGDSVNVAGYVYTFKGASEGRGPNYSYISGVFDVTRNGQPVTTLESEKRIYPVRGMPTTEAAIESLFLGDLYAVIGDPQEDGSFATRLYFNPLVAWMWAGALIMVFGGVLSLTDRRYRVGAPVRRRPPAAAQPAE